MTDFHDVVTENITKAIGAYAANPTHQELGKLVFEISRAAVVLLSYGAGNLPEDINARIESGIDSLRVAGRALSEQKPLAQIEDEMAAALAASRAEGARVAELARRGELPPIVSGCYRDDTCA